MWTEIACSSPAIWWYSVMDDVFMLTFAILALCAWKVWEKRKEAEEWESKKEKWSC